VFQVLKFYRNSLEDLWWKPCQNSTKALWWKLYNVQDLWCMQKVYGKSFGLLKLYGRNSILFKICGACRRIVVKSLVCSSFVAQNF